MKTETRERKIENSKESGEWKVVRKMENRNRC